MTKSITQHMEMYSSILNVSVTIKTKINMRLMNDTLWRVYNYLDGTNNLRELKINDNDNICNNTIAQVITKLKQRKEKQQHT